MRHRWQMSPTGQRNESPWLQIWLYRLSSCGKMELNPSVLVPMGRLAVFHEKMVSSVKIFPLVRKKTETKVSLYLRAFMKRKFPQCQEGRVAVET
ncbi:hypothetical protein PoB_004097800 [Plakobranchus ocellatus]|uniref:Uncharacterized protein n=1 Tax=Plakobranchus ocellatus TaxID=259542 RepID=A0AAV4B6T5_9GAST|nr:hypothetical protein PoB_004097800 [Plakobranchus ocellatus]